VTIYRLLLQANYHVDDDDDDADKTLIIQLTNTNNNKKLSYPLLPLRNRASTMHFFVAKLLSIAEMTYSYVGHLRNLCPANLLRTQRINFSMRPQHMRMTRDPTVV